MAQTTDQVAQSCGKVEIQLHCTGAWYDATGETQSVAGTEQPRMSGDAYTLAGDTALVAAGKRSPMDLVFVIVYTETDAQTYEKVRMLFEATPCPKNIAVRWSPRGGNAGDEQLTTPCSILTSFKYPPLDASGAAVIMGGFTVHTPYVTTSIVAS